MLIAFVTFLLQHVMADEELDEKLAFFEHKIEIRKQGTQDCHYTNTVETLEPHNVGTIRNVPGGEMTPQQRMTKSLSWPTVADGLMVADSIQW